MKRFGSSCLAMAAAMIGGCQQNEAGTVSSPTAEAETPSFTAARTRVSFGCQTRSTSWPWGAATERTWTPRIAVRPDSPRSVKGQATGAPFSAKLVQAYGADYGLARRSVILEMADGCRRQFYASSFSDADLAFINAEAAKQPSVPDPASYRIEWSEWPLVTEEMVERKEINLYETQHFAFWYGNGTDDSYDFARTIKNQGRTMEQVLRETGEWFEMFWYINRDAIGAPMPFADSNDKRKLNIFLCGTGRPNIDGGDIEGCGAGAADKMGISAWALEKGSDIGAHEFGHMIEWYAGGFRDNTDNGPIWETVANWNAFQVTPTLDEATYYLNNLESGPLFSPSRYAAYPFMSYLYENDRTRKLVFDAWKPALTAQLGGRDFMDTAVLLGQKTGAYPNGFASFADDMGWYGARLVTMDFLNQSALYDVSRPTETTTTVAHLYAPLVPASRTNAALYKSSPMRELRQWGTHLIPLQTGSSTLKVTLTGRTTANAAAWRFMLVAVKPGNVPVYSALGKAEGKTESSTLLFNVPTGTKLYLAVTATPYRYETLGWQQNDQPVKGTSFPYTVRVEGAKPEAIPVNGCNPDLAPGTWSSNYSFVGNRDGWKAC